MHRSRRTRSPGPITALAGTWLFSLLIGTALADAPYSEDAIKAAFLWRFAAYVEWPPDPAPAADFAIAVLDANGVAEELTRILPSHTLNGRPAVVRRIERLREVGAAQVLFVGRGHRDELRAAIAVAGGHGVLIATDEERGLETGAALGFVVVDHHLRFEVSLTAADRAGLQISSEALALAIRVQGNGHRSSLMCPSGSAPEQCAKPARATGPVARTIGGEGGT